MCCIQHDVGLHIRHRPERNQFVGSAAFIAQRWNLGGKECSNILCVMDKSQPHSSVSIKHSLRKSKRSFIPAVSKNCVTDKSQISHRLRLTKKVQEALHFLLFPKIVSLTSYISVTNKYSPRNPRGLSFLEFPLLFYYLRSLTLPNLSFLP